MIKNAPFAHPKINQSRRLFFAVLLHVLIPPSMPGQNLLQNAGFEKLLPLSRSDCTITLGLTLELSDWRELNTVDCIHNSRSFTNRCGIPPFSGDGMIGLWAIDNGEGSLPEYLFQPLAAPIKAGDSCTLDFHLHFRPLDAYFPSEIQVLITDTDPCQDINFIKQPAQRIEIPITKAEQIDDAWSCFRQHFKSTMGGKFLVIGYFDNDFKLKKKRKKENRRLGVYILLDDLTLINHNSTALKLDETMADQELSPATEPKTGDAPPAFPALSFDKNSFELSDFNAKFLDSMIPKMANQSCPIRVIGYTDATGDGQALSRKRAEAVADYLEQRGIPKDKILVEAMDSAKSTDEHLKHVDKHVLLLLSCN